VKSCRGGGIGGKLTLRAVLLLEVQGGGWEGNGAEQAVLKGRGNRSLYISEKRGEPKKLAQRRTGWKWKRNSNSSQGLDCTFTLKTLAQQVSKKLKEVRDRKRKSV